MKLTASDRVLKLPAHRLTERAHAAFAPDGDAAPSGSPALPSTVLSSWLGSPWTVSFRGEHGIIGIPPPSSAVHPPPRPVLVPGGEGEPGAFSGGAG